MDLPQEIDDYIKGSIDYTLGLPVSARTLYLKLQASEEEQSRLRDRYLILQSKLKEKDRIIDFVRAEASMNAQALKKFVEENQKLATECDRLLIQCNKWERECSLYDQDREALMDFGNEADQRAKEAEARVQELEEVVRGLSDELCFYKNHYETRMVDSSVEGIANEESLLESVLATFVSEDEVSSRAFLEANSSHESCQRLLKEWTSLKPSTQKVLSLAAEVKALEKDKEQLRTNLYNAEEEVKVLFEDNNLLIKDNKRLLKQYRKENNLNGSSEKRKNFNGSSEKRKNLNSSSEKHANTASANSKSNKRKSSTKTSSPLKKKLDFSDTDPPRRPLSPLPLE